MRLLLMQRFGAQGGDLYSRVRLLSSRGALRVNKRFSIWSQLIRPYLSIIVILHTPCSYLKIASRFIAIVSSYDTA